MKGTWGHFEWMRDIRQVEGSDGYAWRLMGLSNYSITSGFINIPIGT